MTTHITVNFQKLMTGLLENLVYVIPKDETVYLVSEFNDSLKLRLKPNPEEGKALMINWGSKLTEDLDKSREFAKELNAMISTANFCKLTMSFCKEGNFRKDMDNKLEGHKERGNTHLSNPIEAYKNNDKRLIEFGFCIPE